MAGVYLIVIPAVLTGPQSSISQGSHRAPSTDCLLHIYEMFHPGDCSSGDLWLQAFSPSRISSSSQLWLDEDHRTTGRSDIMIATKLVKETGEISAIFIIS